MHSLILYGGTFDPIHLGHIGLAQAVTQQLCPDNFCFIPCKQTLLDKQQACASPAHRLAMLELIIQQNSSWTIDDFELNNSTPSYTINSVKHSRQLYPDASLTWLMGMDAFLSLHRWHQALQLFDYTNLLVVNRPHYSYQPNKELSALLAKTKQLAPTELVSHSNGNYAFIQLPEYPHASSEIRQLIHTNQAYADKVPPEIANYIAQHKLYR